MTNILSVATIGAVILLLLGTACFMAAGLFSIARSLWERFKDWRAARRQWRALRHEAMQRKLVLDVARRERQRGRR